MGVNGRKWSQLVVKTFEGANGGLAHGVCVQGASQGGLEAGGVPWHSLVMHGLRENQNAAAGVVKSSVLELIQ